MSRTLTISPRFMIFVAMSVTFATISAARASDPSCSQVLFKSMKPPSYPAEAVKDHIEGKAIVLAIVGVDGVPANVLLDTSSGNTYLDAAAIEAVKAWRFEPARCASQAIASQVLLPVKFSLADLDADPNSSTASKWDVAPDSEPMEFAKVKDAIPFLAARSNIREMPVSSPGHLAFNEQGGTGAKVWLIDTDPSTGWTTIVRWRQTKRANTRFGLYAYLCDGSTSYCANMRNQIVEFTRGHPLPPPPPFR